MRKRLGSSPLTRGKPALRGLRPESAGLIPAHAGKTMRPRVIRSGRRAHPRSRGENGGSSSPQRLQVGSSPLTRGKPKQLNIGAPAPRLIPAHAGKTAPGACSGLQGAAHPRSRGENNPTTATFLAERGSSPLTRGKQLRASRPFARSGLIPAHAGKTRVVVLRAGQVGAHPRSRGENISMHENLGSWSGSSPLTRGKRNELLQRLRVRRLIPAHAGKTCGL